MTEEIKSTAEEQDKTLSADIEKTSTAAEQEKTFTQAELDRIISERIARERKNLPDEADLKAYKEWKKSQQTEAEKAAEREKELEQARKDAEALRRENAVIKAGVSAEDADYVIFKVGKLDGEFDANLKDFLAENKKYTEPATETVAGTKHTAGKGDPDAASIAAFRKAAGLK